jgi:hypothetical protein
MTSIIKVDNLQNQCGANIISESANVITIGASGDTVTLAAGASQSGFGRSGSVNWDTTPKTSSPVTAVSGNGYFINTTSIAITVNLPATPAAGDIVAIADYNGTVSTNNITIGRNSSNINGAAADFIISKNYSAVSFVYVDATAGWRSVDTSNIADVQNPFVLATGGTVTCCGDYKIHTFTGPGTFTVTNAGNASGSNSVDYLVVAGGGGGSGGGGGAGGFRESKATGAPWTASPLATSASLPVSVQGYPITIGGGGSLGTNTSSAGTAGTPSVFSTITSTGGGLGQGGAPGSTRVGGSGGSGGGSWSYGGPTTGAGGAGNTPPTSPPQGQNGGSVYATPCGAATAAGGGGAGGAGGTSPGSPKDSGATGGGAGGAGVATSISTSSVTYSAGAKGYSSGPTGSAGTTNRGNGGSGGANAGAGESGFAGGSGIVIIRYKYQ